MTEIVYPCQPHINKAMNRLPVFSSGRWRLMWNSEVQPQGEQRRPESGYTAKLLTESSGMDIGSYNTCCWTWWWRSQKAQNGRQQHSMLKEGTKTAARYYHHHLHTLKKNAHTKMTPWFQPGSRTTTSSGHLALRRSGGDVCAGAFWQGETDMHRNRLSTRHAGTGHHQEGRSALTAKEATAHQKFEILLLLFAE